MTGQEIVNRVRAMIDDDGATETQRFKDAEAVMWVNDGVAAIFAGRTDAQYAADGTLITVTEIGALNGTVSLLQAWREALAHYVAARAFQRRSGEADNVNRMTMHKTAFKTLTGLGM